MPVQETVDIFHRGQFVLVQPKGAGHRSGIDAMMLAAAVPDDFKGRLADLGAGAGAAGLAVAARCADANVVLVEIDPAMTAYTAKTLKHESNQSLAPRVSCLESDVTLTGKPRADSGLADNSFDFAIMNPPFNAAHDRRTPDLAKVNAHVMSEGLFEAWLRTASAIVRPGGGVALIARPQSIGDILAALKGRFGTVKILPVHPRANEPAIRIIATGIKGSRAGLTLEPPHVLHGAVGNAFLPRAEAINNGEACLFDPA
ncbi:MAG: methyltransferase [Rhizobiaceae bacterium]